MSWISSTLRSAADDVRRRVDQAESEAHAAVDRAKQAASSAVDAARSRAASPSVRPAPTRAAEKQSSDASVAFAKNALANVAAQHAGTLKLPTPEDIPSLIPNKDEPGSTADKARKYVMLGAGVATGFASSHLGPSGALAQGVIDASIATFGSAEDKTNFGWGQVGGSSIAMLHGAMLDAEGGTIEVATAGGGSAVGIPAIAAGAIQMATAGANIATGMALISSGSPSTPAPAPEPAPSAAPSSEAAASTASANEPISIAAHASTAKPPPPSVDLDHVIDGGLNRRGRPVGYHSKMGTNPDVRTVAGTKTDLDSQGVYREGVEVRNPKTGAWVRKAQDSTFFPDSYSREEVRAAIEEAYASRSALSPNGAWSGVSSKGLHIDGFVDSSGTITTAYPVWKPTP